MAVIAFTQHRLGRTDGVSLEVDKWRRVLEEMGHTVHYISGNDDVPGGNFVPEMYPFDPTTHRLILNATRELKDYPDGKALLADVIAHKEIIKAKFRAIVDRLGVELLVPNNILSVGYNLAGMLAVSEILKETGMKAICHSHDFWWEDSGEVFPTCQEVIDLYLEHAPPAYPTIEHVVINRLGQRQLKERRGLDATVVPNVFDFDRPSWERDEYNRDFRAAIGLSETDIVFLQATRILDRKAVELAIDAVAELNKPANRAILEGAPLYDGRRFGTGDKIVLVCAGYVEGIGLSGSYHASLVDKAAELGVDVIWAEDHVKHSRGTEDGRKIYSLWDSYTAADFVTYPSIWEGWGNQFIEAVYARLPVLLFEYPVYVSDLKQVGFDVVSLGSELSGKDRRGLVTVPAERMSAAAVEIIRLLQDRTARTRATDLNFKLAREHFSMQALKRIVSGLLDKVEIPT